MEYMVCIKGGAPELRDAFVAAVVLFESKRYLKMVYMTEEGADIPMAAKASTPHEPTSGIWKRLEETLAQKGITGLNRQDKISSGVAIATYTFPS
jgi:hypothetical protein